MIKSKSDKEDMHLFMFDEKKTNPQIYLTNTSTASTLHAIKENKGLVTVYIYF